MIKKLILRIKHSLIGYKTRCFIFGKTKTNSKDMKQIEELQKDLTNMVRERMLLMIESKTLKINNDSKLSEVNDQIEKIESEIRIIKQQKPKYYFSFDYINKDFGQVKMLFQTIHHSEIDCNVDTRIGDVKSEKFRELYTELIEKYILVTMCEINNIVIYRIK